MQLELDGAVALVTGSTRGIGLAIAEALHFEGCTVVLNGRNKDDLATATDKLEGSVGFVGDVTDPVEAKRIVSDAVKALGRLDIVVCNVGGGRSVSPGNETYDEWQRVFALNLWSVTNIIEAARDSLAASRGVFVCVSSICGIEFVTGAPITYSCAKAALNAYIRGVSRPLGMQGIRINAVAPGNILFEGSVWSGKLSENPEEVKTMLERNVALKKFGTKKNVAELVAYLSSPRSDFVTGAVWTIDGGQVHS